MYVKINTRTILQQEYECDDRTIATSYERIQSPCRDLNPQ